jgi:fatty-acyl-CoA synthase
MLDRSQKIASILAHQYSVGLGDRVMVVAYNSIDLYEILFACWRLGAIYMPVNWRLAPPELAAIVPRAQSAELVEKR